MAAGLDTVMPRPPLSPNGADVDRNIVAVLPEHSSKVVT
jgi:hypothetical protein